MRVLVCGGRNYGRVEAVYAQLDRIHGRHPIGVLIHGGATGADTLGGWWAKENRVEIEKYPIERYEGGFARNARMLRCSRPQLVVFFPGGNGTKDMVNLAREADVCVLGGLDVGGVERLERLPDGGVRYD